MVGRLLVVAMFLASASVVFWQAFVHTVHRGTLTVPNLAGQTLEEASKRAHDMGLGVVVEEPSVYTAAVPPGTIGEQRPRAGFHVKTGSMVNVRINLGTERVAIPDLRGESLQGGISGLERDGLLPGRRARVEGQSTPDRILATNPPTGHLSAPDTEVDLLVNTTAREELWVMPSLVSNSRETVRNLCLDHQLRLGQIHEVSYPGLPTGIVIRQYPPAGSPLSRSDIVTIWVVK